MLPPYRGVAVLVLKVRTAYYHRFTFFCISFFKALMASLRSDIFFALSKSEHYPLKSCSAAGWAIGVLSGWLLLGEVIRD
jgi:hypothetical protein